MQVSLGRGASWVPPPPERQQQQAPRAIHSIERKQRSFPGCFGLATWPPAEFFNWPFEAAGHPASFNDGSAGLQWPSGELLEASRQQALPASDQQKCHLCCTGQESG